jgi:outer membrane autotransporter protein
MFKSVFAALSASALSAGAALAGPYVNVETNAGWVGDDYSGAVTDLHVGYEGDLGDSAAWYVQGGPALVSVDGEETETEISGKVGASVAITERLGAYGELSMLTADQDFDDLNVGGKLGLKFNF